MICGSHGKSPALPQGPLQLLFGINLADSGTQNGEKMESTTRGHCIPYMFLMCSYVSHQENKK